MPVAHAPKQLQEAVIDDPRLWIRNFVRHPEDPRRMYDFYDGDKENYLWYLVDWEDGPLNPENWGEINILLFARGSLKTEVATSVMGWGVDSFPTVEVDATAPVDDQRYEVMERFKEKVEQAKLDEIREKDKLSHQKFGHELVDENGEHFTSYSHVKSRSAWGQGDKLRGLHGHIGVMDETQDIDEGTFSTFATESIDREVPHVEHFPTLFVIGTPKMSNSLFHKLWQMSDRKTWKQDADPPEGADRSSGRWITQSEPDMFLPESLKDEIREIEGRIQELRDEPDPDEELIADLQERRDEIRNKGFTVRGWHIDQYNCPLHDEAFIEFKKQTYSKKKFENEVKANFYTPENDLLTNEDVWAALDDNLNFMPQRNELDSTVVLGVDWGGGDGEGAARTVITIVEVIPSGEDDVADRKNVLYFDVLDPSMKKQEERKQIDEYMRSFGVDIGIVDEGFGTSDRETLQDEYGHDNLYGCHFGNTKDKESVVWNRFNNKKRFFTLNKTYAVEKFAEDFKRGNWTIPNDDHMAFDAKNDKGTMLVDQLTAPYTDRDETVTGSKRLRVISDRNDDIFDSFVYTWIGAEMLDVNVEPRAPGSHTRPGYT